MKPTPNVSHNMFATAETLCSYEMFVGCASGNVHRFTNRSVHSY